MKHITPGSIARFHEALKKAYGPLKQMPGKDPLNVLIQTILSQNTSDINSNRAYRMLKHKFPDWKSVMNADTEILAQSIRSGGLANIKAQRIRTTLKIIYEREGKLALGRLNKLNNPEMLAYLTSIPGVGVKTACCVMLFAFGRPVMPVDTHVSRVVRRLGWVNPNISTEKIHEHLEKIIPAKLILSLHLYIIMHGRKLCRPHKPGCGECPIRKYCLFNLSREKTGS